jgi:Ser/Thr protein kinase RdoA (MazF antagonist)
LSLTEGFSFLDEPDDIQLCADVLEDFYKLTLERVLFYVREYGILHYDLHTQNILVDPEWKFADLVDWAEVQYISDEEVAVRAGRYMSPKMR